MGGVRIVDGSSANKPNIKVFGDPSLTVFSRTDDPMIDLVPLLKSR